MRLAPIAGQDLGEEPDHAPRQGDLHIRSRLAGVLGKARAQDREREKVRQQEREQERDEERQRKRKLDTDFGWEM